MLIMFKSGEYIHNGQHKVFKPVALMDGVTLTTQPINNLLAEAMRYLGELNSYSQFTQGVDFFIQMSVFREATSSNRIEGATTSLQEALLSKDDLKDQDQRDDWDEIQNYIKATNFAIEKLDKQPLAYNLICDTHKILLNGVRGKQKTPGSIRRTQNWIGGTNPAEAVFVPPPANMVNDLMADLDKYWHSDQIDTHPLLRIAIIHYQFETIHPFLDGNGRLGRLLIVLQLIDQGILVKPAFYLSEYINRHRQQYYQALDFVRSSEHGLDQWIIFFLEGVIEIAKKSAGNLHASLKLDEAYKQKIDTEFSSRRHQKAYRLLDRLFFNPIIDVTTTAGHLQTSRQTANELLKDFCQLGILDPHIRGKRPIYFVMSDYFDLFASKESQ